LRHFVASSAWAGLVDSLAVMKLTRRASNLLLAMGLFMLFSWGTRAFTWYANDLQQQTGYLPFVHMPIIVISLAIGVYLTYLGLKGRRAS
jgi:apolipoprotein N-acyltransferase